MPRCFADPRPEFQRAMRLITAITKAVKAQVTTSFAHNYKTGLIVRFVIPPATGMVQLNQQTSPIVVTSPTTFTVFINTTHYTTFAIPTMPSPHANICAQVIPIGEVSEILTEATQNVLPL